MIIKIQKPIEFNSPAEVLFNRDDLVEAIKWYSSKPVARLKHIFLYGHYYAITIYDKKIHIHRLLMMYWQQRDLEPTEHVHHINGNKFNNLKENLVLMYGPEHISITHKGVPKSLQHRAKMSENNRKRRGLITKKTAHLTSEVLKPLLEQGWSISKIAKHLGVDWETAKKRIYENPELLR